MNSLIFQLAYQAASTVLSLSYVKKYRLGQKQYDPERKRHIKKNVLAMKDRTGDSNSPDPADPSYINTKATKNEPCSP